MRRRPLSPRLVLITTIVLTSLVLGVLSTAQADDKDRKRAVDKQIAQLKGDLEDSSHRLVAAIRALHKAESKLSAAQGLVARIRGRLAAAQARNEMLAGKLAVAEAEVERARKEMARTERRLARTQELIGLIARATYQQGNLAELAVVLNSETPDQFATRVVLVQNAMRSEGATLEQPRRRQGRPRGAEGHARREARPDRRAEAPAGGVGRETIQGLEQDAIDAQREVEALVSARERAVKAVAAERAAERSPAGRSAGSVARPGPRHRGGGGSRGVVIRDCSRPAQLRAGWPGRRTGASARTRAIAPTR